MDERNKYKVAEPNKLSSWNRVARKELYRWLTDEGYVDHVMSTTMTKEMVGPFTRFLYHFAYLCECGWGVMVDFSESRQRVFLTYHYYRWMHNLRDEMLEELHKLDDPDRP